MFSILKFVSGFNIFNGVKLGKIFFYLIIISLCLGTYHKLFIQPTNRTLQQTTITGPAEIHQETIVKCKESFLGLKIHKFSFGVRYGE